MSVCLRVALIQAVYLIIYRWQVLFVHLITIVLQQNGHCFLVDPCIVILVESLQLFARLDNLRRVYLSAFRRQNSGYTTQFNATQEGLGKETIGTDGLHTAGVGFRQLIEHGAETGLQAGILFVPSTDVLLQLLFLPDNVQFLHRLVHTDTVFPVVAAGGELRGIFDGNSTVRIHPLLPHLLLLATHVNHADIDALDAFIDAIAAQITVGRAGIAHSHAVVARLEAFQADTGIALCLQGDVFLGIFCRTTQRVGIDAEYAEVARLARPHPVVRVAAEFSQCLCGGENQADVVVHRIDGSEETVVAVVRLHQTILARIRLGVFPLHGRHHAVQILGIQFLGFLAGILTINLVHGSHHPTRALLGAIQETHEEALDRTLLFIGFGRETILQDVVLGC